MKPGADGAGRRTGEPPTGEDDHGEPRRPTSDRSPTRSSTRSSTRAAGQLEQLDEDLELGRVARRGARRQPAQGRLGRVGDRRCRAGGCPTAASTARRSRTRSSRRAATPPACARPSPQGTRKIDKRTPGGRFDGRAYARGQAQRATGRPVTTPPVADHPPGARADRGAARRPGHRHLRLDGRLRVRARADRLDPHRRAAPDRRALRERAVRQRRRAARRRRRPAAARPRRSRPAAARRSPATRSSSSASSSR